MDRKKDIVKILRSLSGKYSAYEVFSDWVRCGALAISNTCQIFHDQIWQSREEEYINTMKKYAPEEQHRLVEMMGLLVETLEERLNRQKEWFYRNSGFTVEVQF